MNWPLRVKLAALVLVASLLPMGLGAFHAIRDSRRQLLATTGELLAARGDQLVGEMDTFHDGYLRAAQHVAHLPTVLAHCGATGENVARYAAAALQVWPSSDASIRGVAVLNASGVVTLATEPQLVGTQVGLRPFVQRALRGASVVSEIFVASTAVGPVPTIAYLVPVRGNDQTVLGVVALWVRASALWAMAKSSNALAGPGSFAVLFDQEGIRIAHTYSDEIVFHPGAALPPALIDALVADERFGPRTRDLLQDVRAFPEQFNRARSASPEPAMFRGFAPVNGKWNYGVARRMKATPWTLFYMVPEEVLQAQIAAKTRESLLFAGAIMLAALFLGALFTPVIVNPLLALSRATEALARGDLAARVPAGPRRDELGRLGQDFNAMAGRIESQARALEQARDDLELKVQARTAELRQSQARLTALFDAGVLGILVGRLDGQILEINDALLATVGYTREEILSGAVPWASLSPPEWREDDARAVAGLRTTGIIPRREKEYLHKDGTRVPVMMGTALLAGATDGTTISFVVDLQGNKLAAQAVAHLREASVSEAKFRGLLEAAPDAMVIVDDRGKIVLVNGQTERLFGFDRAQLLETPVQALIPAWSPRARPAGAALELVARRKDGTEFPVEVSHSPLETETGVLVSSAIRDISERRKEEEHRFRLAAIVDSSGDAIIGKNLDGVITSWNGGATRMFGYTSEEIVGKSIWLLIPPDRHDEEVEILAQLNRGERIEQFDTVRRRKDGHDLHVSLTSSPVRDSHGALAGASKIVRDITARVQAEAELSRAKETAEGASRELEAFSYSVAHDLRAPLRGMNGFAQVLLDTYRDKLDAQGQDWLAEIVLNAKKMGDLIDGLLSLARVTRSDLRVQHVDLTSMAREAIGLLSASEPQRLVAIDVQEGLGADADPRLARALLDNLLGNAWKFTSHTTSPRIEVGMTEEAGASAFFVRDNGAGFDMAYASKLFAPFQRLHTVGEFPGTGIGLATAQRIINRHGGRISATGTVGGGASFTFTFPERTLGGAA